MLAQAPAPTALDAALVSAAWPGVVTVPVANRIENQVRAELTKAGMAVAPADAVKRAPGMGDACKSNRACLAKVGLAVRASVVLLIEPATVGKEVAVVIQAIVSADASLAAEESFSVSISGVEKELPARLTSLITTLQARRAKPKDVPLLATAPVLTPAPVEPPPTVVLAPEKPKPVLPWVLGGGAVAAGVAAGVFAGMAASNAAEFRGGIFMQNGAPVTRLTQPEVDAAVARTNTDASVALAAGIGAGLLAAGALVVALVTR